MVLWQVAGGLTGPPHRSGGALRQSIVCAACSSYNPVGCFAVGTDNEVMAGMWQGDARQKQTKQKQKQQKQSRSRTNPTGTHAALSKTATKAPGILKLAHTTGYRGDSRWVGAAYVEEGGGGGWGTTKHGMGTLLTLSDKGSLYVTTRAELMNPYRLA